MHRAVRMTAALTACPLPPGVTSGKQSPPSGHMMDMSLGASSRDLLVVAVVVAVVVVGGGGGGGQWWCFYLIK